ncbi:MAG: hypothetical protein U0230_12390 [Polyangiales bacterium]
MPSKRSRPSRRDFDRLADILDEADEGSTAYDEALARMEALAEAGSTDAAETVAEIFSSDGRHRDPEKAYRWYAVALGAQGYSTDFLDLNDSPPSYRGRDGDFRNEARVNELVAELGFERVRAIDASIGKRR